MDCVTAQSLISDAMDREPVEAGALAEAKKHCRDCADCSRFVRGQLIAKQAPLPAPPADLADRVMAAVRAEARAADDARATAELEAVAASIDSKADGAGAQTGLADAVDAPPSEPLATLAPPAPRRRVRLPRPFAIATIAAVLLVAVIGAGTVAVIGFRTMSPANTAASKQSYTINPEAAQTPAADNSTAGGGKTASSSAAVGAVVGAPGSAAGPHLITLNNAVYSLVGPAGSNVGPTAIVGNTTTSLGDGKPPISRQVLSGSARDTVYIADDTGQLLGFTRVTRSYLGLTYSLTAKEITDFGQWPALPAGVIIPTSSDGSPTFVVAGTDDSGARVYRLSASPVTAGIAIAPNGDSGSAMSGDPNWSWWTNSP